MELIVYKGIAEIERDHWWYRGRRAIIKAVLAGTLPLGAGRRILSVGCGMGGELEFLKAFGEVSGIDPSEDALSYCRERGYTKNIHCAGAEKIPFHDKTFDAVFILDALEHVKDDARAAREMFRVLRPGGYLIVTTPAFKWLWSRADERSHHFRRYTRRGLAEVLHSAGFGVERSSYFNTVLFLPIALAKIATRLYEPAALAGSEVKLPPKFINELCYALFRIEAWFLRRMTFPFGISVGALAQRPVTPLEPRKS